MLPPFILGISIQVGPELIKLKCPKILFRGVNPSHDSEKWLPATFFLKKNIVRWASGGW